MKHMLHSPLFIKWEITNQCNLRCKFCFKKNYKDYEDNTDTILDIIKKVHPYSVTLLGGEPTLHKKFTYIVNFLSKNEIHHSFSTNGYTLYKNDELLDILAHDSYLTAVQVSIESPDKIKNDLLRGKNSFDNALRTVEALNKKQIPVEIGMVIKKDNSSLIPNMMELMKSYDITDLRLMPFIPIGQGKKLKDNLFLTFDTIKELINQEYSGVNILSDINTSNNLKATYGCGAGITTVNINMDMTLSPCDLLADVSKSEKFNDYMSFMDRWKNDRIFNEWRFGKKYDDMSCGRCPLFEECGGYD